MLKLGSSEPWQVAMQQISGTDKMDASAVLEYFQPLMEWLQNENQGEAVGWEEGCPAGSFDDNNNAATSVYSIWTLLIVLMAFVSQHFL